MAFIPGEIVNGFFSLGDDPEILAAFAAVTQARRQGHDIRTTLDDPDSPLSLIQARLDQVLSSEAGKLAVRSRHLRQQQKGVLPHIQESPREEREDRRLEEQDKRPRMVYGLT